MHPYACPCLSKPARLPADASSPALLSLILVPVPAAAAARRCPTAAPAAPPLPQIQEDVGRLLPKLKDDVKITVVDTQVGWWVVPTGNVVGRQFVGSGGEGMEPRCVYVCEGFCVGPVGVGRLPR